MTPQSPTDTAESLILTATSCRICDSTRLIPFFDLGNQPPANALRAQQDDLLPVVPLVVCRCDACETLQLRDTVDPSYLFSSYVWVTGTSSTAVAFSREFCRKLLVRCPDRKLRVVEVACNDGTFLKPFLDAGHLVMGYDPAANLAHLAVENGVATTVSFFDPGCAERLVAESGLVDCLFARNVLAHVNDIHGLVEAMAICLDTDGCGAVEFHYLSDIMNGLQYDSIYHEHVFYYSVAAVTRLLAEHGLHVFDVADSPISGGAKIVYFSPSQRQPTSELRRVRDAERDDGLSSIDQCQRFAERSAAHARKLRDAVTRACGSGGRVVGYGASARSSTLLNFAGLGCEQVQCIADRNPIKHGKLTPGTDIPIVSPDAVSWTDTATVVLLAWNFAAELIDYLTAELQFRGRIIVPLPGDVQVLGDN